MNINPILGLLALVVVVGSGVWFLSSQGAPVAQDTEEQAMTEGAGTFGELMSRTGSWMCTVAVGVEEAPSEGTVFISDGKIRADFTSRPQALSGKEVVSHMIQADGYVYTWSDLVPQGMKMQIPESTSTVSTTAAGAVSADAHVDYSCEPWVVDMERFAVPSTIGFMEFDAGAMIPGY